MESEYGFQNGYEWIEDHGIVTCGEDEGEIVHVVPFEPSVAAAAVRRLTTTR